MLPLPRPMRPLQAGRRRARRGQLQRSALEEMPITLSGPAVMRTIVGLVERALTIVGKRMRIIVDPAARVLTGLGRRARTTPTTAAEQTRTIAQARTTRTTVAEPTPTTALVRTTPTIVEPRMRPKVGLAE